jgi:hypothetical protein
MANLEEQQRRAETTSKLLAATQTQEGRGGRLIDRVRAKESDIRTKDERQFVGMDLVLHPEAYEVCIVCMVCGVWYMV